MARTPQQPERLACSGGRSAYQGSTAVHWVIRTSREQSPDPYTIDRCTGSHQCFRPKSRAKRRPGNRKHLTVPGESSPREAAEQRPSLLMHPLHTNQDGSEHCEFAGSKRRNSAQLYPGTLCISYGLESTVRRI